VREDLVTQAALEAYGLIRHESRLADRALDFTLRRKEHLYSNERRAVAERVYALLRRQITVDHLLARARPGYEGLSTSRQDLLRLCASRVLEGEDADTIIRTERLGPEDARALEALPTAARSLQKLPPAERFAISASLPPMLAEKLRAEFGDQAEAAAEALNERAPLTARVNTLKIDREGLMAKLREEGVECRPTPLSPIGVFLETRINAFSLGSFREGLFELQDEGSQLLGMLVDPPPTKVVDACAGAGGKTLQMAADMKNRGEIFALDVDERRLEDLKKRTRRDGVHNVRIRPIPPEGPEVDAVLSDLMGKADRVLVDAPCSGTGTFRRKPDARYRLSPADLATHVARQKRLLSAFSKLVKGSGRLVYGTCSLLREENEAVVEAFLKEHPEFQVRPVAELLGAELGAKVTRGGFLRLFPHQHGTDGFFGAVLVRTR
jgi:16S rRNA (cytosine967-C5)-methyltransferase